MEAWPLEPKEGEVHVTRRGMRYQFRLGAWVPSPHAILDLPVAMEDFAGADRQPVAEEKTPETKGLFSRLFSR